MFLSEDSCFNALNFSHQRPIAMSGVTELITWSQRSGSAFCYRFRSCSADEICTMATNKLEPLAYKHFFTGTLREALMEKRWMSPWHIISILHHQCTGLACPNLSASLVRIQCLGWTYTSWSVGDNLAKRQKFPPSAWGGLELAGVRKMSI